MTLLTGKLKKIIANKQLKALNFNNDSVKLLIDTATIEQCINTNTLRMHDVSGLHRLIGCNQNGFSYPYFAIYKRKGFTHDMLTSRPMHPMPLGMQLRCLIS